MTQRTEFGITWTQTFNAENWLSEISNETDSWEFAYDGDGNRVKQVNPDGTVTLFVGGGLYTVEDAAGTPQVTKYYAIAGQRVAMDDGNGLKYLLTDHLGSVVAVTDGSGQMVSDSEQRYMPFGEPRLAADAPTDFGYTGQRSLAATGLMDYNARFYDAALGRFVSADKYILPVSSQNLNRYSYVLNNPFIFTDPTGNKPCEGPLGECDLKYATPWSIGRVQSGLRTYGVKLNGKFKYRDAMEVYNAVTIIGASLGRVTGGSEAEGFKAAFGSWTVTYDTGLHKRTGYFGQTKDYEILLDDEFISQRLIAHEFGHAFDYNYRVLNSGGAIDESGSPVDLINRIGIWTSEGDLVTIGGNRYANQPAPRNGYYSNDYTTGVQWHPRDMAGGNSAVEDWADIFLNWAYGSFYPNRAGITLNNWVNSNLPYWLPE